MQLKPHPAMFKAHQPPQLQTVVVMHPVEALAALFHLQQAAPLLHPPCWALQQQVRHQSTPWPRHLQQLLQQPQPSANMQQRVCRLPAARSVHLLLHHQSAQAIHKQQRAAHKQRQRRQKQLQQ